MKKWFLLDRIELKRSDITIGNVQFAPSIEPDTTYAVLSFADDTAMSAGKTFDPVIRSKRPKISLNRILDQEIF
jgi:hypothetical protein